MYIIYRLYMAFIDIILIFPINQIREDFFNCIGAKDLYIQNITVSKHDNHIDSFQVKFRNVFTNYMKGGMGLQDQKCIGSDHYRFTLWQTQLNFVVFCTSSACGVSVKHLNAKNQC